MGVRSVESLHLILMHVGSGMGKCAPNKDWHIYHNDIRTFGDQVSLIRMTQSDVHLVLIRSMTMWTAVPPTCLCPHLKLYFLPLSTRHPHMTREVLKTLSDNAGFWVSLLRESATPVTIHDGGGVDRWTLHLTEQAPLHTLRRRCSLSTSDSFESMDNNTKEVKQQY